MLAQASGATSGQPLKAGRQRRPQSKRVLRARKKAGNRRGRATMIGTMHKATVASLTPADLAQLARQIKGWGRELGFQQLGITDTDLSDAEARLIEWLGRGYHGEMDYMARHGASRARPAAILPGTVRVIAARMNYRPQQVRDRGEAARRQHQQGQQQERVHRAQTESQPHDADHQQAARDRDPADRQPSGERQPERRGPAGERSTGAR